MSDLWVFGHSLSRSNVWPPQLYTHLDRRLHLMATYEDIYCSPIAVEPCYCTSVNTSSVALVWTLWRSPHSPLLVRVVTSHHCAHFSNSLACQPWGGGASLIQWQPRVTPPDSVTEPQRCRCPPFSASPLLLMNKNSELKSRSRKKLELYVLLERACLS